MNKKTILTVGVFIVTAVLFILKLRKTINDKDSSKQSKTAKISIEKINSRSWSSIACALQTLQGEIGHLDMANLEFVEDGDSLTIRYNSENRA